MRRIILALALLLAPCAMHAQVVGPGFVNYVTSAPSGACSQGVPMQVVLGSGAVYTCQSGTWGQVSGGGSGTVSSGTTNTLAKYTAATTVGNSLLTDDGTTLAYSGTGGFSTTGANGGITATEGTGAGLTPASNVDLLYADSTAHRFKENANNTGAVILSGIAAAGTAGNIPKLATNGIDVIDSTIPSVSTAGPLVLPTLFPPFAINVASSSMVVATNEMDCVGFTAPISKTFTKLTYRGTASAGVGSHVGLALYNSDGTTRVATSGALDGTLVGGQIVTFSGTIIQNNFYNLCWTDDAATSTTWGVYSFNTPVAQLTGLYNTNTVPHFFKGANASVAGAPPTQLGAFTANTTGNPANTPIVVVE